MITEHAYTITHVMFDNFIKNQKTINNMQSFIKYFTFFYKLNKFKSKGVQILDCVYYMTLT